MLSVALIFGSEDLNDKIKNAVKSNLDNYKFRTFINIHEMLEKADAYNYVIDRVIVSEPSLSAPHGGIATPVDEENPDEDVRYASLTALNGYLEGGHSSTEIVLVSDSEAAVRGGIYRNFNSIFPIPTVTPVFMTSLTSSIVLELCQEPIVTLKARYYESSISQIDASFNQAHGLTPAPAQDKKPKKGFLSRLRGNSARAEASAGADGDGDGEAIPEGVPSEDYSSGDFGDYGPGETGVLDVSSDYSEEYGSGEASGEGSGDYESGDYESGDYSGEASEEGSGDYESIDYGSDEESGDYEASGDASVADDDGYPMSGDMGTGFFDTNASEDLDGSYSEASDSYDESASLDDEAEDEDDLPDEDYRTEPSRNSVAVTSAPTLPAPSVPAAPSVPLPGPQTALSAPSAPSAPPGAVAVYRRSYAPPAVRGRVIVYVGVAGVDATRGALSRARSLSENGEVAYLDLFYKGSDILGHLTDIQGYLSTGSHAPGIGDAFKDSGVDIYSPLNTPGSNILSAVEWLETPSNYENYSNVIIDCPLADLDEILTAVDAHVLISFPGTTPGIVALLNTLNDHTIVSNSLAAKLRTRGILDPVDEEMDFSETWETFKEHTIPDRIDWFSLREGPDGK